MSWYKLANKIESLCPCILNIVKLWKLHIQDSVFLLYNSRDWFVTLYGCSAHNQFVTIATTYGDLNTTLWWYSIKNNHTVYTRLQPRVTIIVIQLPYKHHQKVIILDRKNKYICGKCVWFSMILHKVRLKTKRVFSQSIPLNRFNNF